MKLDDRKSDTSRFPADALPLRPARTTAVIQVQFKTPIQPAAVTADPAKLEFAAPSGFDLSNLRAIVKQNGLLKVEHSFRSAANALLAGAVAPSAAPASHKAAFVDLHFPPTADVGKIVAELRGLPEVERAVEMPTAIPPNMLPTDPLIGTGDQVSLNPATGFENEWYIFRCGAQLAWPNVSGKNVIIADIDFGYRTTHEDLAPNLDMNHAHNSFDGTNNVAAGGSTDHGTGVLGLAAAASNAKGMAGFAWGATLWPIQANAGMGQQLPGDAFANAIDWVTQNAPNDKRVIINLEVQTGNFGNYEMVPAVNSAIQDAIARGIVVCVAAGNGNKDAGIGDDGTAIPLTGSILVGATAYDPAVNQRAWFSNFGARIVVAAPGDSDHDLTCSNASDDAYRNGFGGTSGATPKVSGTVALMLEANPSLTHAQVKQILTSTGTPIPVTDGKPVGVFLNTAAAVASAAQLHAQLQPA